MTTFETPDRGGLVKVFKAYGGHDCFEKCAYDKPGCRPGSGGYHGIGSLTLFFAVAVPGRGAVSLELHTPMYPASAHARGLSSEYHPLGVVDLHYPTPPEYLAEYGPKDCNLIGGKCWTDCTYLAADEGYGMLLSGGESRVWVWLAEKWLPEVVKAGAEVTPGKGADEHSK